MMTARADVSVQSGRGSTVPGGQRPGVGFWAVSVLVAAAGAYLLHHLAPLG